MRRWLGIAFAVVALVAAGAVGWVLLGANRLAERYRPDLERAASRALGAPVQLGKVRIALLPNVAVAASDVSIGAGGFTLADVRLRLGVRRLLHGTLAIDALVLEAPHLVLERSAAGVGLIGAPRPEARSTGGAPHGAPAAPAIAPALALDLRRFQLRHGTVELRDDLRHSTTTLTDLSADAALALDASRIALPQLHATAKLSDGAALTVDAHDAVFDVGKRLLAVPAATMDVAKSRIAVSGRLDTGTGLGSADVRSDGVDLAEAAPLLALVAPEAARLGVRGTVSPDLKVEVSSGAVARTSGTIELRDVGFDAGGMALTKLHGHLDLAATPTGATVGSRDVGAEAGGTPIAATLASELTRDTATLRDLVVTAFGGTTRVVGTYGVAGRAFTADVRAEGLDLGALEHAADPRRPPRVTGTVARFESHVAGTMDDSPARSLTGTGTVLLRDARVPGVNVTGEVVKKIGSLPVVSRLHLSPATKIATDASETVITSLSADLTIGGSALHLQRANVSSPSFAFDGGGRVGFDAALDLQGTFRLSAGVSRDLVSGGRELGLALDDRGQLALPLTIHGTPPKVSVQPDVTRLVGSGLENAAGGLLKGLEKLLKRR
jgi:hypothetical protein